MARTRVRRLNTTPITRHVEDAIVKYTCTCQPVLLVLVLGVEEGGGEFGVERVADGGEWRRDVALHLDVERSVVAGTCAEDNCDRSQVIISCKQDATTSSNVRETLQRIEDTK